MATWWGNFVIKYFSPTYSQVLILPWQLWLHPLFQSLLDKRLCPRLVRHLCAQLLCWLEFQLKVYPLFICFFGNCKFFGLDQNLFILIWPQKATYPLYPVSKQEKFIQGLPLSWNSSQFSIWAHKCHHGTLQVKLNLWIDHKPKAGLECDCGCHHRFCQHLS